MVLSSFTEMSEVKMIISNDGKYCSQKVQTFYSSLCLFFLRLHQGFNNLMAALPTLLERRYWSKAKLNASLPHEQSFLDMTNLQYK